MALLISLTLLCCVPTGLFNLAPYEEELWVPYKEVDGAPVTLDLYLPRWADGPHPVVLFVHGGAWRFLSKRDYRDYCKRLAFRGVAAATVEFRRNPTVDVGDQVDDVKDAIRWVRAHAEEYDIDPDRIGIFGSSSGAHLVSLAVMASDDEWRDGEPQEVSSAVQAAVYVYGMYDMTMDTSDLYKAVIGIFAGLGPDADIEELHLYSSINYVDGSEPPTLIVHGKADVICPEEQAKDLVAALDEVGVPVDYMPVAGQNHGFLQYKPFLRRLVFSKAARFFDEHL